MTRSRLLGLLTLAVLVQTACTTTVVRPSTAAPVAAQLSVERFLQASNQRDVYAMGNLFGTKDGPAMDTGGSFGCFWKKVGSIFGGHSCVKKAEVEVRMDMIASILRHDDYMVVSQRRVPGRDAPTTQVMVDMTVQGDQIPAVPFEVVQTSEGRWLVQAVNLEHVMTRGR